MIKHVTVATHLKVRRTEFCSKIPSVAKIHFWLSCFPSCVILHREYTAQQSNQHTSIIEGEKVTIKHIAMATQSLKCDGRKKNGTVDSVRRTYKLCCYSNTFNCGHSVFACYESTLAVHSENPLMVSNLTTGNSGQLKM